MPSLGCFVHPSNDFEDRSLDDLCPKCDRPYRFPLTNQPARIRDFTIQKPLGRGFYGAIYLATSGPFQRPNVLKVIPTGVYAFHKKDFAAECRLHYEVATGTDHVVGIGDYFEDEVAFGDLVLQCHVAVLDYVDGVEMDDFLASGNGVGARSLAQLAIDIFRLLQALEQKGAYHNDLHHRNLLVEQLPPTRYRPEAIDETIRLVAVDLGSLADHSRSGPPRQALGDLRSAAAFLVEFAVPLLTNPDQTPDSDYRLASTLVELAALITGESANIRTPDYEDFISQIRQAYVEASSPWRPPAGLTRLNDAYNAQTLHPCFVPRLLVDPGGEWLAAVSTGGPQVITGVRGCGKTMLLRGLQFHARLSGHMEKKRKGDSIADLVRHDGFVGLYLSARRLLDALGNQSGALHEPYARLLVGYAREGVRAARHLAEEEPAAVRPRWWESIGRSVTELIAGADTAGIGSAVSPEVLERRLQAVLFSLDRGEAAHRLVTNPAIAFPALAEAVRGASPAWDGSKILFLLDDVSTRHLEEASIAELLGTLLFSDDHCAFKLTTEGQTLELALKSPGLVERARADRDYEPFDLAARVNEKLKHPREGKRFLAEILKLRADQFKRHPRIEPAALLGDTSLEDIARHIVATDKNAGERKTTYWGLTALTAVCVGDIGDVLNIYDSMLRKPGAAKEDRIPRNLQNEAFQEYASRRLYHLNRRKGDLKDYAMSFAKAAHDLLQRSARPRNGERPKRRRLRQYVQIYVRITTGDEHAQFERLRELIDAGVFVLESGVDSPRKKTRDADPISQFILTYRKLFGLTQYIGLAFSDRFELSGDELQEWLFNPADGREILMRNLGGPLTDDEAAPAVELAPPGPAQEAQQLLFVETAGGEREDRLKQATGQPRQSWPTLEQRLPSAREVTPAADVVDAGVRTALLGLGFEDRCLASASEVFGSLKTTLNDALLVRYPEKGHSDEIETMARRHVTNVRVIDYGDIKDNALELPQGPIVVDVTGLAKPVLFHSVRQALLRDHRVVVVHAQAEEHYPLDSDVAGVFSGQNTDDVFEVLERAGRIWSGEMKPYSFVPLLASDLDDSRPCLLCAAASAKHERLLSLMEERTYDAVDILVPESTSPRAKLARFAADVATRGIEASRISEIDSNDLTGIISFLAEQFRAYYLDAGFGIEFGLTGSKMHAVACAAASTAFKLAQVWYVSPARFDPKRFTRGVGATRWFMINRPGTLF